MSTPKFDRISDIFCLRIGQVNTYAASVLQNGNILTAAQVTAFVNKALFEHIRRYWTAVNGDVKLFGEIFPELISAPKTILLSVVAPTYIIANPNLDFMKMFGAIYSGGSNVYIRIAPKEQYVDLKSGVNTRLAATAAKPVLVELDKTLYLFPTAMAGMNIDIIYIKQPLNPTNGAFLTQNGTCDSPFYDTWNSEIAGIAEILYKQSVQEGAN